MDAHTDHRDITTTLKRRILSVPTLLSLGIAAAFIYFLAARFDLDWSSTWESIRAMDPWSYALALALYYLSFVFRGVRWRILAVNAGIHDEQSARLPSVPRASQLIVVGWFVNSIAWLRLGDAYRAYAFSEDSGRTFSWSLGTVLAERVVDMATVLAMIAVSIALFSIGKTAEGAVYVALFAALFMASALGVLLALMKGYGARFARLLPSRIADSFTRFRQGTLGSLKQLHIVFLLGPDRVAPRGGAALLRGAGPGPQHLPAARADSGARTRHTEHGTDAGRRGRRGAGNYDAAATRARQGGRGVRRPAGPLHHLPERTRLRRAGVRGVEPAQAACKAGNVAKRGDNPAGHGRPRDGELNGHLPEPLL